ncbi:MAG: LacI family DNA-binding transcriptional regulator [Dongiaceae bacterium]
MSARAVVRKRRPSIGNITLGEVALAAKVSPMTVSNYINGKFQHMREDTRQRVASAVERLNYRPHTAARGLRRSKHLSVGVVIVDESPLYLSDGYTNEVISGLTNRLNEHDLTLQLEGRTAAGFARSSLIRDVRTDGLFVMLSGSDPARRSLLDIAMRLKQPIVVLLEQVEGQNRDICCVTQDDRTGGRLLAEHLLERGARRLLFLRHSLSQWWAVGERERGIAAAVARFRKGATLTAVDCGNGSFDEAQASLRETIERYGLPDAVMGANDRIGIAALKFLKSRKIAVPGQVKVTGFNAFDFWRYSSLILTTVRSRGYEIGQIAGDEMVRRLSEGRFSRKSVKLPLKMVLGDTT